MISGQIQQSEEVVLGWIGTGVMGQSMARHLMKAGFQLVVYSRTKEKAEPLLEQGAQWAESPQALASRCQVVFTMVGFPQDLSLIHI